MLPEQTTELRPTVKRDLSLFSAQAWRNGFTKYLKETLGWSLEAILYFDGGKVNFYHCQPDFIYFKEVITKKLIDDDELFIRLNKIFQKNVWRLNELTAFVETKNLVEIFELIGKIYSFYIFVVSDTFVKARPEAWSSREMSEGVLYVADGKVETCLVELLRQEKINVSLAHFLNIEEVKQLLNGELVENNETAKRQNGYILFDDELLTDIDFLTFCKVRRFVNSEIEIFSDVTELHGEVAYKGRAQGRVKIIENQKDFSKIQKGDILVATMTNVNYLPLLKQTVAFITDEGGITCHAAILSRELKKPCIIGTKIATQVLHDGDLVEVDADNGVVRKL